MLRVLGYRLRICKGLKGKMDNREEGGRALWISVEGKGKRRGEEGQQREKENWKQKIYKLREIRVVKR